MKYKKHNSKYYIVDVKNLEYACIQSRNENQLSLDVSDYAPTAEDIINSEWKEFDDLDDLMKDALDFFGVDKFDLLEKFIDIIGA